MEKAFALLVCMRVFVLCLLVAISQISLATNPQNLTGNTSESLKHKLLAVGVPAWIFELNGKAVVEAEAAEINGFAISKLMLPVTLSAEQIGIHGASLQLANGRVNAELQINLVADRFQLAVAASDINLDTKQDLTDSVDQEYIFGTTQLTPTWMEYLHGEAKLTASDVRYRDANFSEFDGRSVFDGERFVAHFNAQIDNGSITGKLNRSYRADQIRADIRGQNISLSKIAGLSEFMTEVPVDFQFLASSRGNTARAIASNLSGELIAEFGRGNINIQKLDKLSKDILSLTLSSLIPISVSPTPSVLECGAIELNMTNGLSVSENSIALRTQNLAIMGGGTIDLAQENLNLVLYPRARNNGKYQSKTAVSDVTISGPFNDLAVNPHIGGLIKQGISLTSKIASYGLSKLAIPIFDWATPPDAACMESLQAIGRSE